MKKEITLLILSLLGFTGCNYTILKGSQGDENLNFSLPSDKISYADVAKNIDLIKKVVFVEKSMPKKGFLTDEELSYLWNWIKIGAPEQASDGSVSPEPEPIISTYDSINRHVFQTSCKECHNPTGTGKRVLLDKSSLLDSPLELVIPGNPDESGLVIDLERTDDKRMPPAKEGYSALKDEAKIAIRKWIENGAKD
jgi:uncharacterized membrane protein